jgi:chemotaxis response regulator CheB
MKLNCVVVDDSSIQRMIISKLVNNHPSLHLIGDFSPLKQKLHVYSQC